MAIIRFRILLYYYYYIPILSRTDNRNINIKCTRLTVFYWHILRYRIRLKRRYFQYRFAFVLGIETFMAFDPRRGVRGSGFSGVRSEIFRTRGVTFSRNIESSSKINSKRLYYYYYYKRIVGINIWNIINNTYILL